MRISTRNYTATSFGSRIDECNNQNTDDSS